MSNGNRFENRSTWIAAAATLRGQAMKLATNALQLTPATAASDVIIGFAATAAAANDAFEIYEIFGDGYGLAAATAITKGTQCKIDTSGKLVATAAADDIIVAIAMEAIAANSVGRIKIVRYYRSA